MNNVSGKREAESKRHIKRIEEHAKALLEGRQRDHSLHPMKELCWLVSDLIQFLTFSDEMHTEHSAAEQGWGWGWENI